jgi:hypothetical protein
VRTIERTRTVGRLAALAVIAAAACRAAPVPPISTGDRPAEIAAPALQLGPEARAEVAEAPAEPSDFEAPAGWESQTDLAFERAIDGWLPAGEPRRVSEATLAELGGALSGGDVAAVRAAVMLGRARDPKADEVLLARLEERVSTLPGQSERDAADVVAAAALAAGTRAREAAARLTGLAVGRRPHPSVCVRVECARSAIALGRDESIAGLLAVLREGTTAGRVIGPDEDSDDLAWAQVRAAEGLAARAGTTSRFRPEGSVADREAEAARLEGLLPSPTKR